MLILPKSRFDVSASRPIALASNHGVVESGLALVLAAGANGTVAKVSTGGAGEVFAGFALTDQGYPSRVPAVRTIVGTGSTATGVATLPAYIASSAVVKNAAGATSAHLVVNSDGTVDLAAGNVAGAVYTIQYSATPTMADLVRLFGEFPRQGAIDIGAAVGAARNGSFAITNFDTSVNFALLDTPVLGANGFITKGGSGTVLSDYRVSQIPTVGSPYLVLDSVSA